MSGSRQFLGSGFAFPLRVDPRGSISRASEEQLVQQSIWVILATAKGELQRNPRFGCGIHDFVFAANTPANRAQIAHQVRQALLQWEARIDLIDVRVTEGEAPTQLLISIDYRLRANHAFGNLVYPFYLFDQGSAGNAA
ncbi:GPW/gp25 family protein [Alteraurantiacibacter aquimixticola]|uniref:Baseplate protein n=1 Tax=Alteraurantiacibacter aquimixticola TaxID=2489173 RepID=A0A4T3EYA4_9SPHN|nr:GPW/gp25 family protein [Alteraurantiacibacter aquimixticola]TIX49629.1 baseplate protein [Alteraurantiacibacter aquimixticola]